jgi:DNA polymerase-3 subunit alpha
LHPSRIVEVDISILQQEINDCNDSQIRDILYLLYTNKKISNHSNSWLTYCLGVTDEKPKGKLARVGGSLPDIDCDFAKDKRDRVIDYVFEKYGKDKVAQIGTYTVFKPRSSLRSFARVCGYGPEVGTFLANMVPPDVAGKQIKFDELNTATPELFKTDYPEVVNLAQKAEGLRMQTGVHAAGIVISDCSIKDIVPLFLGKHKETATQFDMHDIEEVGLVKYDFLGLRNLTVIQDACDLIKQNHNRNIDFSEIEDRDEKVYSEIFRQGKLDGVFQFETSSGFKELCMQIQPKCIEDLSIITALFRPGPLSMKDEEGKSMVDHYIAGRKGEEPHYLIPELESILKDTYGIMIFQEQVMKICVDVAGYSFPEADNIRKIIGKKLPEKMKIEKEKFVNGCIKNKIPENKASKLFDDIEGFALYSFNAAHSIAYSIISYRTAWLKTYFPHEFYTALLNSSLEDQDKMVKYIHAAKEDGIAILPPDINKSGAEFTLNNYTILFGFAGIKGIGASAVEHLIENRPERGFSELEDLVKIKVKKDVLVALAECGALEEITSLSRKQIKEQAGDFIDFFKKTQTWQERTKKYLERENEIKKALSEGHKPPRRLPKVQDAPVFIEAQQAEPLTRMERLRLERNTLVFYLTGHPLDDYPGLMSNALYTIQDLKEGKAKDRENVAIPAAISSITEKRSKDGKNYAVLLIEDTTGRIEATAFSKGWESIKHTIQEDSVGVIQGRVNKQNLDEESSFIVRLSINNINIVEQNQITLPKNINITLKDGTNVSFLRENQSTTAWQQTIAYCNNLQRMD